jgi:hypothetical protein
MLDVLKFNIWGVHSSWGIHPQEEESRIVIMKHRSFLLYLDYSSILDVRRFSCTRNYEVKAILSLMDAKRKMTLQNLVFTLNILEFLWLATSLLSFHDKILDLLLLLLQLLSQKILSFSLNFLVFIPWVSFWGSSLMSFYQS